MNLFCTNQVSCYGNSAFDRVDIAVVLPRLCSADAQDQDLRISVSDKFVARTLWFFQSTSGRYLLRGPPGVCAVRCAQVKSYKVPVGLDLYAPIHGWLVFGR
ncbi:hypothetical protein KC19_4G096000 [Ceratodon purpureus]|uniref:Uncharacterized protein n=1 Tax=Ceratodon purpureus TaxID=3225 RepID=A0A8T0I8W3_CERPU|nr:hypothetical protein KC19_4G095500 [Ceratodon purpureus]KAG0579404.1 hypothetical protein KC19_4G096000 [Ceratodon purpureus]